MKPSYNPPIFLLNTHNMKLTRKQIKDALAKTPIEKVLLGHTNSGIKLTAKQKAFAEKVAEGMTKAEAYRTTYDTQASKQQQGHQAHMLSQNPKIKAQIEAQKVALEAMKYQNAEHLRALAVHRLTQLAIDEGVKPAQQLKALELIGKITEVALFTERREVIKVTDTAEAKAKLIESLKLAMRSGDTIDADFIMTADAKAKQEADEAESLLAEIAGHDDTQAGHYDEGQEDTEADDSLELSGGTASTIDTDATPLHPDPLKRGARPATHLHSIPHTESPSSNESLSPTSESTNDT